MRVGKGVFVLHGEEDAHADNCLLAVNDKFSVGFLVPIVTYVTRDMLPPNCCTLRRNQSRILRCRRGCHAKRLLYNSRLYIMSKHILNCREVVSLPGKGVFPSPLL